MSRPPSTIAKARAIARRNGWLADMVKTEVDALAVIDGGCYFDPEASAHVVRFFREFLTHSVGEWARQPFDLFPWQRDDLIAPLFGWKRADGTRRYRRGGVWIPKKNGKTTLCAGICMYMLVGDHEPGAQVFSAANDKNQAAYIYREMASMVRQSGDLSDVLDPVDTQKIIHLTEWNPSRQCAVRNGSYYQALSADVATKEGLNISALIVDELHALADRSYWSALAYGGASRRQPLVPFSISTAGIYDPASIGWEQYQFARGVRDGTIEDWSFFSLIYEADPIDDWTDERTWRACNPSYNITVKPEAVRAECLEAQESPAKHNDFLRYHLNIWVQQNTRAIDLRVWDENRGHDALTEDARAWYGGLDLGGSSDLSAWVMVGQCPDDPEAVDVRCRFWLPEETLNGKHPNVGLYRQWARSGHLMTTPGNIADERFIQRQIEEDAQAYHLVDANIDRLFQGMRLAVELQEAGISMLPFGQGFFSMAAPTKKLLDLIAARRFHHCGHPILRWMADNVVLQHDPAGNCRVDKKKSAQKVDGIVACVMAVDRFERRLVDVSSEAAKDFEERGLFL